MPCSRWHLCNCRRLPLVESRSLARVALALGAKAVRSCCPRQFPLTWGSRFSPCLSGQRRILATPAASVSGPIRHLPTRSLSLARPRATGPAATPTKVRSNTARCPIATSLTATSPFPARIARPSPHQRVNEAGAACEIISVQCLSTDKLQSICDSESPTAPVCQHHQPPSRLASACQPLGSHGELV